MSSTLKKQIKENIGRLKKTLEKALRAKNQDVKPVFVLQPVRQNRFKGY